MYFIYKITNQINNKNYIGSSTVERGINTRWEEHKKASRQENNQSYNYPLQKAMRKYGIENFSYEILKSNILTLEERAAQEKYYIIKYNSLANTGWGYNQTLFTDCSLADPVIKEQVIQKLSKKVALVDNKENIIQIFESLHAAANFVASNSNSATIVSTPNNVSQITKICNGEIRSVYNFIFRWVDHNNKVIIPNFKTRPRRTKIIAINKYNLTETIYFDSILKASETLKLDRTSIQRCLSGDTRYKVVGNYIFRQVDENNNIVENGIPLQFIEEKYITLNNGETHTLQEWCEILSISRQSIYYYMKKHSKTKQEALNYYLNKKKE